MQTPYKLYKTLSDLELSFDPTLPLYIDIETCGFYQKIRLVQLYQKGMPYVSMVEWPNVYELIAFTTPYKNVGHNLHYEATTFAQQSDTKFAFTMLDDTFLMSRLYYPQKEHFSLDNVMDYVLGFDPYAKQKLNKQLLQKSDWAVPVLSDDQKLYAATDVYYLPQVYETMLPATETFSYRLDMLTLGYCLDFQWNGMPLDKARLYKKWDEVEAKIAEVEKLVPVNVNSPKQVKEWLNVETSADLELARIQLSPDETDLCFYGANSTGTPKNEAAGLVRKLRKLRKQVSFMKKFDETAVDGRIYGKFKPSARSGRLTSDDQNQQQHPRSLKGVFGLTEESNRVIIYADYAQIELRHICALVGCKLMEELFRRGEDLHTYTSDMILGTFDQLFDSAFKQALDVAQERRGDVITAEEYECIKNGIKIETMAKYRRHRQISKTCNFNLLYGGGAEMLISILVKTAEIWLSSVEANRIRTKWRNLWKEIYAWQERGIAAWKKGRLGSTPLGRKYSSKMMTDQLNIENQGGAADVNKLAMHYLMPALVAYNAANNTDYIVINNIHDSFLLEGPRVELHYKAIAELLATSMQRAWFECSRALKVRDLPMPVDVKVGLNWGDIEDDDVPNIYDYSLEPYAMLEAVQNGN